MFKSFETLKEKIKASKVLLWIKHLCFIGHTIHIQYNLQNKSNEIQDETQVLFVH